MVRRALRQPLYTLVDAIFHLSQSSAGWIFSLYLYIVKPTLHVFFADVINRSGFGSQSTHGYRAARADGS